MNSTTTAPSSRRPGIPPFFGFLAGAVLTYFVMQHARDAADLAAARAEQHKLADEQKQAGALRQVMETRLAHLEQTLAEMEARRPQRDVMFPPMERRGPEGQAGPSRAPTFRNRMSGVVNRGPLPPPGGPDGPVVLPFPGGPRRSWGHEQATGEPDTPAAGDQVTAWASRTPDGGEEWLRLGYEKPVEIAEVRIRETYNPGAVTRVAAVIDGREQTVWEGIADQAEAPREFVVPVKDKVVTQTVVIYLDTSRVAGWNEIDAVELVGKDGSRQWAKTSASSSSFGDNQAVAIQESEDGVQPIPSPSRQ